MEVKVEEQPTPFHHQVAGHTNEKLRRYKQRFILKPLNKPDLFAREVRVYRQLYDLYQNRKDWFAKFHGVEEFPDERRVSADGTCKEGKTRPCIILEDLTLGFAKPCLIDIKMGKRTYEPTASIEKIAREKRKYPYQEEIGFRITGLKVWDSSQEDYHFYDKHFGRSLTPDCVATALALFFHNGLCFRPDVIEQVIEKLRSVLNWVQEQSYFQFYCSSILVVYDGDYNVNNLIGDANDRASPNLCNLAMIDFAHVLHNDHADTDTDIDDGYAYGVSNLIAMLESLVQLIKDDGEKELKEFVDRMETLSKENMRKWEG